MEDQKTPIKPDITLDDIMKLDIRIGEVKAASLIEGTELIKQEIYFGDEIGTKTILSKISKYVHPEYLIGRSFPYIINLPPRKMKGVESQGMIVAISNEHQFHLIETEAPLGSIIF